MDFRTNIFSLAKINHFFENKNKNKTSFISSYYFILKKHLFKSLFEKALKNFFIRFGHKDLTIYSE